jgi:VanZ family protein
MRRLRLERNLLLATAVVIAVIVYGSLHPFVFRQPAYGLGPVRTLLESWKETPSRGDFIANMLLYMPLGFFAILAIGDRIGSLLCMTLVGVTGTVLSTFIELAQYYDDGRVAWANDLYANVLGTALGAGYDLLRHTAIWLAIGSLIEASLGRNAAGCCFRFSLG